MSKSIEILQQRIAKTEEKLINLKEKAKKKDNAEKAIIGGAMLAYAKKSPNNAKYLLEIIRSEQSKQNLKCIQKIVSELENIVAQATPATKRKARKKVTKENKIEKL